YFLRAERRAMRRLIAEIFGPATRYEYELPVAADIVRALELDAKFEALGLGLVDGIVAAVAERRRVYRVLTSDRRDFGAIRVGPPPLVGPRTPAMKPFSAVLGVIWKTGDSPKIQDVRPHAPIRLGAGTALHPVAGPGLPNDFRHPLRVGGNVVSRQRKPRMIP